MEPSDPFTNAANRIFASWRTTLLAALIIATVLILGLTGTVGWDKMWTLLGYPLILLWLKDPHVVNKEKTEAITQAVQAAVDPNAVRTDPGK